MGSKETRIFLAGAWLQGMAVGNGTNVNIVDACSVLEIKDPTDYDWKVHFPIYCAKRALAHADALIAEIEKNNG